MAIHARPEPSPAGRWERRLAPLSAWALGLWGCALGSGSSAAGLLVYRHAQAVPLALAVAGGVLAGSLAALLALLGPAGRQR